MTNTLIYRHMYPVEAVEVSELVGRVFDQFVAPEYSAEGVAEFRRYVRPEALLTRLQAYHFILVGLAQDQVVGMIEVRNHNHVALLFVASEYQGQGVAKMLLRQALHICRVNKPGLAQVTVNSSPFAVPVYTRLGFRQTGVKQMSNGIIFIPMVLDLPNQEDD